MDKMTIKIFTDILETTNTSEGLQPYKDLGNGLYELPGNIICNKKGLDKYLNNYEHIRKEI